MSGSLPFIKLNGTMFGQVDWNDVAVGALSAGHTLVAFQIVHETQLEWAQEFVNAAGGVRGWDGRQEGVSYGGPVGSANRLGMSAVMGQVSVSAHCNPRTACRDGGASMVRGATA